MPKPVYGPQGGHHPTLPRMVSRGAGRAGTMGWSSSRSVASPPPCSAQHSTAQHSAVALLRKGQNFVTIQRAVMDITDEQTFLVNQRQLNNWVKIVDKLEGCVVARTAKHIKGRGRRVHYSVLHLLMIWMGRGGFWGLVRGWQG